MADYTQKVKVGDVIRIDNDDFNFPYRVFEVLAVISDRMSLRIMPHDTPATPLELNNLRFEPNG